jgi:hypothetical protein
LREDGKKKLEEEKKRLKRDKLLLEKAQRELQNAIKGQPVQFCLSVFLFRFELRGTWVRILVPVQKGLKGKQSQLILVTHEGYL